MASILNNKLVSEGQREEGRMAVGRTAILRVRHTEPAEVLLADITRNGCRIVIDRELAPGDAVTVGIAGVGPVAGRVVWHGEHGYGCRFDAELPAGACTAAGCENVVRIGVDDRATPSRSGWAAKYPSERRVAILAVWCVLPWLGIGTAMLLR